MRSSFDQDYAIDAIASTNSGGLDLDFTTNALDNITALTSGADGNAFDYDALNRLTAVREPDQTLIQGFAYDDTGNRLSKQVGGTSTAYTYPTGNHRLTAVGGAARTFDAAGNTLTRGDRTYVYNTAGRMVETKTSGTLQREYRYNARGERVRSFLTGSTPEVLTVFDEAGHVLGEYSETGAAIREVVWLDDLPVAMLTGTTAALAYLEPDHLGTPRAAIDPATSSAIWKWSLIDDAFGEAAPDTDPDGNSVHFTQPLRFPGQVADADTGLNYNYFRDYEPGTGRYVESDPIGLKGGLNTYRYSFASPLTYFDPSGLAPQCRPLITIPGGTENVMTGRDLLSDSGWYLHRVSADPPAPGRPMMGRPHSSQGGGWGAMIFGTQSGDCWATRVRSYKETYEVQQLTHLLEMCTENECGNPRSFLRIRTSRETIDSYSRIDMDREFEHTRASGTILALKCLEWVKSLR